MTDYEKAKQLVKCYNQEQLLFNYEKLPQEKRQKLAKQILTIDFDQVNRLFDSRENIKPKGNVEPISYVDKSKLSHEEIDEYKNRGIEEVRKGKLAVVTMAGRTTELDWDILDLKEHLC